MSKVDLHIVAFDVPLPADYGGVIDVFYKLEALSKLGVRIALHCFEYGRGEVDELKKYATEVYYYPRKVNKLNAIMLSPFSVKSRKSELLLQRLSADSAPILFESLQSCFYLDHPLLAEKQKWVRAHNVEHDYYNGLAKYEALGFKKAYYLSEAKALRSFEPILKHATGILSISIKENDYFKSKEFKSKYLPAFFEQNIKGDTIAEVEDFALYQGNLQVEENEEAALFLIEVFRALNQKLIIAGNQPTDPLRWADEGMGNLELIANPNNEKMTELIQTAKLNCLPAFQTTGIKLKLLNALTFGNEVLVNSEMIEGTGLDKYCTLAQDIDDWRKKINELLIADLALDKIQARQRAVASEFDNQKNAKQLVEWLGLAQ